MHFYHVQPSELRALNMSNIAVLCEWREQYCRAEAEQIRQANGR